MIDTNDICRFGHQLAPGSTKINVGTLPNGKPDVRLLRKHATPQSQLQPHGHDHRVVVGEGNQYFLVPHPECQTCSPTSE